MYREFLENLHISQSKLLCCEVFAVVRQFFQEEVFAPLQKNEELQKRLGLGDTNKSVLES